jgi:cobalamin-dependent methionine synthase I
LQKLEKALKMLFPSSFKSAEACRKIVDVIGAFMDSKASPNHQASSYT